MASVLGVTRVANVKVLKVMGLRVFQFAVLVFLPEAFKCLTLVLEMPASDFDQHINFPD